MTNLTANDVENIEGLFSRMETCWKNYILPLATGHLNNVNQRKNDFNINIHEHFNIFTAIAEKYRHENLHSDLLKVILGNEKNNIGNRDIFYKFLERIQIDPNDKETYFSDYNSIKFEREYPIEIPLKGNGNGEKDEYDRGRIDLLIHTEDACIIIENKVNNAPDQKNQLGKYYIYMEKKEKKRVLKIVYLTIEEKPRPDNFSKYNFNDYILPKGSTTKSIKEEIEKVLINLPCVKEQNVKTFTEFLEEIKELAQDEEKKTFIKHYKLLIESIGGKVLMIDLEKKLIREIMESKTNIQAVEMLIDTWKVRTPTIGKLLVNDMQVIDSKMSKDVNCKDICQRKISNDVYIYYTFEDPYDNNKGNDIEFGFRPTGPTFTEQLANTLKNTFNSLEDDLFQFAPKGNWEADKTDNNNIKWVYAHVYDLGDLTYTQIRDNLKTCLKTLKKEAQKALNSKEK